MASENFQAFESHLIADFWTKFLVNYFSFPNRAIKFGLISTKVLNSSG